MAEHRNANHHLLIAMETIEYALKISIAWWVNWYLRARIVLAYLGGPWPDPERVADFIMRRGARLRLEAVAA